MSIEIDRPVSPDLVPTELKPAIMQVISVCRQTFNERLQSVYLLGSAARGEYRPGVSDFDMRAIVSTKEKGEKESVEELSAPLRQEFNIAKLELDVYPVDMLNNRDWLQFYVLVDGICVWGKPYEATFPLPTSKEALAAMLASHLLEHHQRMPESLERIQSGKEQGVPDIWRTYAKRAIRLGNVISILKTGQYTQNSDRMVENIIRNVPEIAESIEKLNQYTQSPPTSLEGFIDLARETEIVHTTVLRYGLNK